MTSQVSGHPAVMPRRMCMATGDAHRSRQSVERAMRRPTPHESTNGRKLEGLGLGRPLTLLLSVPSSCVKYTCERLGGEVYFWHSVENLESSTWLRLRRCRWRYCGFHPVLPSPVFGQDHHHHRHHHHHPHHLRWSSFGAVV